MAHTDEKIRLKTFTFSLATPYGSLPPLSVEVPDISLPLHGFVPLMQEVCNKVVKQACTKLQSGEKVTCGKGCGFCCRQVVPVSVPEVMFLREYLDGFDLSRRETVQQRFQEVYAQMQSMGILDALRHAASDQEALAAAKAYFDEGLDCPFLDDGACSIHEVRPFACREFNAVSPPALCRDPFHNRVQRVAVVPRVTSVMARFAAKMTGEPPQLLPLVTMAAEEFVNQSWSAVFPGISLFETLLACMNTTD